MAPPLADLTARVARAEALGQDAGHDGRLLAAVRRMHEQNPMLGLRGVRLGLVVPGLFAMQVRAVAQAAAARLRAPPIRIGTMIEVPRAGPALALRLAEHGARVTVVEIAPRLRGSGFAVDFRGPTHTAVLERLGVLDDLRARQTHGSAMTCVDEHDREIFTLPAAFTGGELEVRRRDLSRLLHDRGAGQVEYLFGDTITSLYDTGTDVRVGFRDSGVRLFDLVIGADGMHSTVRRLTFGDEHRFLRPLGYHIAGWDLPNAFGVHGSSRYFTVPGRTVSIGPDPRDPARATAMVVFRSTGPAVDWHDEDAQKKLIAHTLAGLPWHVPAVLDALTDASDLYFDAIAKVASPAWTRGRIALLGDAAWGVTLGGMGVGTGLVGAHVLAGELASAGADHRVALHRLRTAHAGLCRTLAERRQSRQVPRPRHTVGLALRNRLLAASVVQRMLLSGTKSLATDADLPDYPGPPPTVTARRTAETELSRPKCALITAARRGHGGPR